MQVLNEKIFLICLALSFYYYDRENKSHLSDSGRGPKLLLNVEGFKRQQLNWAIEF